MTPNDPQATCRTELLPRGRAFEFASYGGASPDPGESAWPRAPGGARFDLHQRAVMLHFAPGRWLVPAPTAETFSILEHSAQAGAGVIIDVTGKFDACLVSGPGARRLLACTIDVEAALESRECAAMTLFDCPVILARAAEGFAAWIQSSYTADFIADAERFQAALTGRA